MTTQYSLTPEEKVGLDSLRTRGFAVVIFNPSELREAVPEHVAERMIQYGWNVIDEMSPEEDDE